MHDESNHPLREKHAVKYLRPGLEVLQEVQRTGDIFFPKSRVSTLLQAAWPLYREAANSLDM